jgi:mannose-6-phosphate isomerase-like protein (cupin superfamily)
MRRALGATAFGINQLELAPGAEGFEHDESSTGQEEVYVYLSGSGVLHVEGEEIPVYPGRWVLVRAGTTRKPVAGPDGLSWVAVGSVPGGAYEARDPF